MKKLISPILLISILFGCNSEPKNISQMDNKVENNGIAADVQTKDSNTPHQTAYHNFQKKVFCKNIQFEVAAENGETTKIHVSCDQLSIRKYEQDFNVKGQLKYAFGPDQNEDGFCELYLIVEKNDGSGNLDIIGVASFNDKSAGEITVNDVTIPRRKGSDKVYVHYEKLTREFYDENGVLHIYSYELKKGEAGYILQALRYK